jgi:hypothetical protein
MSLLTGFSKIFEIVIFRSLVSIYITIMYWFLNSVAFERAFQQIMWYINLENPLSVLGIERNKLQEFSLIS